MILNVFITAVQALIVGVLLKITLVFFNSYRMLLRSKCFEGPRALPIVGNAHHFVGSPAEIFEKLRSIATQYPSPLRLWMGPKVYFGVHEPEDIKLILTNRNALGKTQIYDFLHAWMGEGLITAPVPKWKLHRRAIQPLFNIKSLERYIEVFTEKSFLVGKQIAIEQEGRQFNAFEYTARYSLDTICETTMGISMNAITNKDCLYQEMVEGAGELSILRIAKPWLYPDFIFKYSALGRQFFKCTNYIRGFAEKVLNRAKVELDQDINFEPVKSLMTQLYQSSSRGDYKFSHEEIHDEISTIVTVGYDSTANLLAFSMLMFATYPEIQEKAFAEVREIFGESYSEPLRVTLDDLNRLEYLDRFIKETLRFFPAAALIGRHLEDEVRIGKCTFPAGSDVMIELTKIQRSEKYWLRPLEFLPDRFLPNHPLGPQHPFAYIPFSSGSRNCIGMRYAIMSSKILLSTLLSKYIIKTELVGEAKDVELKTGVTLKPKYPVMVSVEKRYSEEISSPITLSI